MERNEEGGFLVERSRLDRFWDWFVSRTKIEPLITSYVPRHALSPIYCLGGTTFLFFTVLAVTGVLLSMYYVPSPDAAFTSIETITKTVPYGWLIRSVHFYSSNGMLILAVLHMFRVYYTGSYKAPRELNWVAGVTLGLLTLFAGYTGYTLRWDQEAVGASGIGKGVATSIPYLGRILGTMLWGKGAGDTLSRYAGSHMLLIPGVMVIVMAIHFWMVKRHGISGPL
jgi:quinol-cytochrome oxidoreductase complex cytochrome b subunit